MQSKQPKILLIHPGTQHAPRLALELSKLGWLRNYITSIGFLNKGWIYRVAKLISFFKKTTSGRVLRGIKSSQLVLHPTSELVYLIQQKFSKKLEKQQSIFIRNRNFQQAIKSSYLEKSDIIIGFDTSSWIIAEKANQLKKHFILDQTTTHPREKLIIFNKINRSYPDWQSSFVQKSNELIELEQREYDLSSTIVVASTFAEKTLLKYGVSPSKIKVNPYGVDLDHFHYSEKKPASERLIYLFIGTVSAGKGIPFLIEAWKKSKLGQSELWIVGNVNDIAKEKLSKNKNVKVFGKVAHKDLRAILDMADVFVFPSFFDGFGLVILEAMACGLPVITTTATGGPDVITNGKEGFITSPGDETKFIEHMEFFFKKPSACNSFGKLARETAERFTWKAYRERWEVIINETLDKTC